LFVLVVLEYDYVSRLRAFLALNDIELYALAFLQIFVSFTNDSVVMDKNIFAFRALNETKTFGAIEPLNGALFFFRHDLELLSSKYC